MTQILFQFFAHWHVTIDYKCHPELISKDERIPWQKHWESETFVARVTEMFASRETFFSPAKMSPPVNVCEDRHGLTNGY